MRDIAIGRRDGRDRRDSRRDTQLVNTDCLYGVEPVTRRNTSYAQRRNTRQRNNTRRPQTVNIDPAGEMLRCLLVTNITLTVHFNMTTL